MPAPCVEVFVDNVRGYVGSLYVSGDLSCRNSPRYLLNFDDISYFEVRAMIDAYVRNITTVYYSRRR